MPSLTVFTDLDAVITGSLSTFVYDKSALLINWLLPIFSSLVIIYLALWGYGQLQGRIEEPITEGFKRFLRISVIVAIGLTVTTYNSFVVTFFTDGPTQIAGVIAGTTNYNALLDTLITDGYGIGFAAWEKGGIVNGDMGMYIIAIVVWITVSVVSAYAAFLIISSKVVLALLLAVGAIFIVLALFQSTQRFFESWLGQVINYAFLLILASATVSLIIGIFASLVSQIASTGEAAIDSLIPMIILAIISVMVLRQIPTLAASLGGGFALATQGVISGGTRLMNQNRGRGPTVGQTYQGIRNAPQNIKTFANAAYTKAFGNTIKN